MTILFGRGDERHIVGGAPRIGQPKIHCRSRDVGDAERRQVLVGDLPFRAHGLHHHEQRLPDVIRHVDGHRNARRRALDGDGRLIGAEEPTRELNDEYRCMVGGYAPGRGDRERLVIIRYDCSRLAGAGARNNADDVAHFRVGREWNQLGKLRRESRATDRRRTEYICINLDADNIPFLDIAFRVRHQVDDAAAVARDREVANRDLFGGVAFAVEGKYAARKARAVVVADRDRGPVHRGDAVAEDRTDPELLHLDGEVIKELIRQPECRYVELRDREIVFARDARRVAGLLIRQVISVRTREQEPGFGVRRIRDAFKVHRYGVGVAR